MSKVDLATDKNNISEEKHIAEYDQNLLELREIINGFQKGNMPLYQAVDKYKRSEHLIIECKKALADFELIRQANIDETNLDMEYMQEKTERKQFAFEDKLQRLEQITSTINSDSHLSLEALLKLVKESKVLIYNCQSELKHFQHIIEYKNITNTV